MNKRRKKKNLNRSKEKFLFTTDQVDDQEKGVEQDQYLPEVDTELFAHFLQHVDQLEDWKPAEPNEKVFNEEQEVYDLTQPVPVQQQEKPILQFGLNLSALIDSTLEVFTISGPISGTLLSAKSDFLTLIDPTQTPIFVPYQNVEYLIVL